MDKTSCALIQINHTLDFSTLNESVAIHVKYEVVRPNRRKFVQLQGNSLNNHKKSTYSTKCHFTTFTNNKRKDSNFYVNSSAYKWIVSGYCTANYKLPFCCVVRPKAFQKIFVLTDNAKDNDWLTIVFYLMKCLFRRPNSTVHENYGCEDGRYYISGIKTEYTCNSHLKCTP